MDWLTFSTRVDFARYSSYVAVEGRIATVLGAGGTSARVEFGANEWYPFGTADAAPFKGFRYVDMDRSYQGVLPMILGEGSNCLIVVLVDTTSSTKFGTHISATSDAQELFDAMRVNLDAFSNKIGHDPTRVRMYVFSENVARRAAGSYEHANLMALLSAVFSDEQLLTLAERTYLIEGEAGTTWNAYSSVRVDFHDGAPRLQVAHARL